MKEDDLVHAASETDGPPNGQLTSVQIEELIDELSHPEYRGFYSADGGWMDSELDTEAAEDVMGRAASALRFLLQEREPQEMKTAPKDEQILAFNISIKKWLLVKWDVNDWFWFEPNGAAYFTGELSAWKPLPAPPQRQGDRPVLPHDGDTRETNGPQL